MLRETNPKGVEAAREMFKDWFDRELEKNFGQLTSEKRARIVQEYPSAFSSILWSFDESRGYSKLQSEARHLASHLCKRGTGQMDRSHLEKLIAHGLRELRQNIFPKREKGDFSDEINDRLVREALQPSGTGASQHKELEKNDAGPKLKEAIEGFLREHGPSLREKTSQEYSQTFGLAVDLWGEDYPVQSIEKPAARDFKDLLVKLPTNMTQRYPGKSLQEAVAQCKKDGKPTISAKTINKKLSNVSTMFNWLKKQGYIDNNPFSGLAVPEPPKHSKRDPFDSGQLKVIFSDGAFAKGHMSRTQGAEWQDLENYWIPLIALFTGMRLGEIAQLGTADVRKIMEVWVFDIHERGSKQLKTTSSRRQVPVHDTLIRLGLLDYHQGVNGEGHDRLFPDMKKASDGYESSAFSKRFGRYLKRCGVKTSKLTFHSFRHTIKDVMREAGIDRTVQDAICGHDDGSVQASYGHGYSAKALHEQLHKIDVPVDLSHLE